MLVATAGHIDHGKTTLVRALTGVETDRLPEERARGISIDLGFAYWTTDDGDTIGFVDVPGHERFVRNMLAGVGGVDFALVVVAADDGVMPQTIEHVQILDLLGLTRGAIAITKCDRAAPERIADVRAEATALLAHTGLAGVPMFEVAATSGAGVPELAKALREAARASVAHDPARNFRLSIDRAFTVTGTGTVVTGTVLDGAIETGARLVVAPAGHAVRVRGLQSAGKRVTRVEAGERCALNLAGVEVADVHRGDRLVTPEMDAPTTRIEARVRVLADREAPLAHASTVHLHIGTTDIPARVLTTRQAGIAPGAEAIVRLVLDQRTTAVAGDRFILRDQSGRALIGGGRVVDPFAPNDRRRQSDRPPVTAALEQPTPAAALAALFAIPGHEVDTRRFEQTFNLTPDAAEALYREGDAVLIGKGQALALPVARVRAIGDGIVAVLEEFHREQPEAAGMAPRALRAKLAMPISAAAMAALLKELAEQHRVALGGSLAKLPSHAQTLNSADNVLWERLVPWLDERGLQPFAPADIVTELRTTEGVAKALLYRRRQNGDLWRVTDTRYLSRDQVAALAAIAERLTATPGNTGFTVAHYRDASGIGRNFVIQLLEFFDRIGISRRHGNERTIASDYREVLGLGETADAVG